MGAHIIIYTRRPGGLQTNAEVLLCKAETAIMPKGSTYRIGRASSIGNGLEAQGILSHFLKATEGPKLVDDRFGVNSQGARSAGLLTGAYHFTRARNEADVNAELEHFVQTVESAGGLSSFKLPLALDVETKEGGTRANITAIVREWVTRFKLRTGQNAYDLHVPRFHRHLPGRHAGKRSAMVRLLQQRGPCG
ncbi:GH25 family lysozyme [Paenibacillus sp. JTLBN-2024]